MTNELDKYASSENKLFRPPSNEELWALLSDAIMHTAMHTPAYEHLSHTISAELEDAKNAIIRGDEHDDAGGVASYIHHEKTILTTLANTGDELSLANAVVIFTAVRKNAEKAGFILPQPTMTPAIKDILLAMLSNVKDGGRELR